MILTIGRTLTLLLPFQDLIPSELLRFLHEFYAIILEFYRLLLFAYFIFESKVLILSVINFFQFLWGFFYLSVYVYHYRHFLFILNYLVNNLVFIYDTHFSLNDSFLLNFHGISFDNHRACLYILNLFDNITNYHLFKPNGFQLQIKSNIF